MLHFFVVLMHVFFFFNDTATTEIYTLSLHDALPISSGPIRSTRATCSNRWQTSSNSRSEEHTSELQSRFDLVCSLLLEKTKKKILWSLLRQIKKILKLYPSLQISA